MSVVYNFNYISGHIFIEQTVRRACLCTVEYHPALHNKELLRLIKSSDLAQLTGTLRLIHCLASHRTVCELVLYIYTTKTIIIHIHQLLWSKELVTNLPSTLTIDKSSNNVTWKRALISMIFLTFRALIIVYFCVTIGRVIGYQPILLIITQFLGPFNSY